MTPDRGPDLGSLVSGLILIALGALLLFDQADVLDVRVEYMAPAVLAALGGIMLACGLAGRPRGE